MKNIRPSDGDIYSIFDYYDDEDDDSFIPETYSEKLSRLGKTNAQVRGEYSDFAKWFDGYVDTIEAPCRAMTAICLAYCDYAEKHALDSDDITFLCLLLADSNHVIFRENNRDKESVRLSNFLTLTEEMREIKNYITSDVRARKIFHDKSENILFKRADTESEISFSELLETVKSLGFSGECLEDNLRNIYEKLSRSEELTILAPLIYYSALMRYTSKMCVTQGFELNFPAALSRKEYELNKDNGKNIKNAREHLRVYSAVARLFAGEDYTYKFFYDRAFAEMSNIAECELIDWENFNDFNHAPRDIYRFATSFVNGADIDNPCFGAGDVDIDDIICFEDWDASRPPGKRVYGKFRRYIFEKSDVSERYAELIKGSRRGECMPLVIEVINNSKANVSGISPDMVPLINAVISEIIGEKIDRDIEKRLSMIMGKINDTADGDQ